MSEQEKENSLPAVEQVKQSFTNKEMVVEAITLYNKVKTSESASDRKTALECITKIIEFQTKLGLDSQAHKTYDLTRLSDQEIERLMRLLEKASATHKEKRGGWRPRKPKPEPIVPDGTEMEVSDAVQTEGVSPDGETGQNNETEEGESHAVEG